MSTLISRLGLSNALVPFASETANLTFSNILPGGGLSTFENIPTSIFNPQNTVSEQFTWTNNTGVTIKKVYLGDNKTHQIIAEDTPLGYDGDSGVQLNVSLSTSGINVTIDQPHLVNLSQAYPNAQLIFQIQWAQGVDGTIDDSVDFYSYSQVWGLASDPPQADAMYKSNSAFGSVASAMPQGTSAFFPIPTQTTTAAPTITASPSSTSSSDDTSSKSASSPKYGLLSQDALIGTIVGGVAFLVLILLVAFLCIRRHRRNTRNQRAHERDAQELMDEKEARAAGIGPDTPYSVESSHPLSLSRDLSGLHENALGMPRGPLAGEGSQRSSGVYSSLRNVTAIGTTTTTRPGSGSGVDDSSSPTVTHPSSSISLHEPYADLVQDQFERSTSRATSEPVVVSSASNDAAEMEQTPLSPGSIRRDESLPRAGSGSRVGTPHMGPTRLVRSDTPGGVSISDYLQEDGMTEEEIKRLEEEERALDEAIEQARADSRAARGR